MDAPAPSLAHISWRAPEFLVAFGPLTRETAMPYFLMSPFADRGSNNNQLRMQMQFQLGGMEGVDEEKELMRFTGTEYVLASSQPPALFIVHERLRSSPTSTTVQAAFYILNSSIYAASSMYTIINERITTALLPLSKTLSEIEGAGAKWEKKTGNWAWEVRPAAVGEAGEATAPEKDAAGVLQAAAEAAAETVAATGDVMDTDAVVPELNAVPSSTDAPSSKAQLGADDGGDGKDKHVPSETFNPLLFRALQLAVAGTGSAVGKPAARA